jgi:hypothetical protein
MIIYNIYTYEQESEAVYLSGLDNQHYVLSSKEFSEMAKSPREGGLYLLHELCQQSAPLVCLHTYFENLCALLYIYMYIYIRILIYIICRLKSSKHYMPFLKQQQSKQMMDGKYICWAVLLYLYLSLFAC